MSELLNVLKTCLGWGYAWGADGRVLTMEYQQHLESTFGKEHYHLLDGTDVGKWRGKNVIDCSGLIIFGLQKLGKLPKNADYTAAGLYTQLCNPITLSNLKPGDLVFRKTISGIVHVGIYSGGGKTIEAKGTKAGVVEGSVNDFNLFGRLKCIADEMTTQDAINILHGKGIIASPEYWEQNAVPGGIIKGEFAAQLIVNFAKKLNVN
jgi:cell wall-associated NlpC family hydrolase